MIRTVDVTGERSCRTLCYMEPNCVSYNFNKVTRKCELNNSTLREGEGNMEKNPSYIYYGAKVQIICLLEENKFTVKFPIKEVLMDYMFSFRVQERMCE